VYTNDFSRRTFLRRTGLAAAGAAVPLLAPGLASAAATADPDQLFRDGWFAAADRGYARILRDDATNAHAVAQRGYIALLGNRFPDAEKYLSRAVSLAPGDIASQQRLAECFVRQDKHARAVPLLRGTGRPKDTAFAELYSHLEGPAWQVHGASSTRVPFLMMDPVPAVEVSLNGGPPKGFLLDTYSTLDLNKADAEEAGLRPVASFSGGFAKLETRHLRIIEQRPSAPYPLAKVDLALQSTRPGDGPAEAPALPCCV
jgi:hypothetical protein